MSFSATTLKRSSWIGFLLGFLSSPLFAQAPNSPVVFDSLSPVVTTFLRPPTLGNSAGNGGGSTDENQWLKVEFHYAVLPSAVKFLDSVEFRIWIEGRDMLAPDAGKDGIPVALTGNVTYVNVPVNKDVYGAFYVHPSTLARYSTDTGTSDFDRKFDVHVEAYVGDALVDGIDKNKGEKPDWFKQLRAVPNLVYRQNQSPFLLSDLTHYPEIKLTDSNSGADSTSPPSIPPAAPAPPAP